MNTTTRRAKLLSVAAAVPLALLLMAGCAPAASGGSAGQGEQTPSAGQQYTDLESWQIAYKKCMSEKGYDLGSGSGGLSVQPSGADFDAAAEDCLSQLGDPPIEPLSAEEQQQIDDARLAFYECLRREGYDAETPQGGGGAASTGGFGGAPQEVIESCGEESGY